RPRHHVHRLRRAVGRRPSGQLDLRWRPGSDILGLAARTTGGGRWAARRARQHRATLSTRAGEGAGTVGMTTTGSLHGRIYTELEDRILSGEWQPGARIPFEHELTEQYGCSRMTVNKAISELAGRGLVIRRRRAGTFVAAPRTHAAVLAIPDL